MANKQYATVKNDYEMTLNSNSEIVEADIESSTFKLPSATYNFTKISDLGRHISSKRFVGACNTQPESNIEERSFKITLDLDCRIGPVPLSTLRVDFRCSPCTSA